MAGARTYEEADIERIVRALYRPRGVLTRAQLIEQVGCKRWAPGRFDAALRHARREGRIVERAGEFYELSESERAHFP